MPKRTVKRSSEAIPAKPKVYDGSPPLYPSPPPSPKHPMVDITAPPENPELAIAMHFVETATERTTAELLWALPHLKGAMPRSSRQCDLVSAEIARRQQAQARHPRLRVSREHL
jgi:hypothetical protein